MLRHFILPAQNFFAITNSIILGVSERMLNLSSCIQICTCLYRSVCCFHCRQLLARCRDGSLSHRQLSTHVGQRVLHAYRVGSVSLSHHSRNTRMLLPLAEGSFALTARAQSCSVMRLKVTIDGIILMEIHYQIIFGSPFRFLSSTRPSPTVQRRILLGARDQCILLKGTAIPSCSNSVSNRYR